MKTRETTPGKTYSVHTMKGCTIIEPDGWQKTIEAPDGYFDAHFGSVVIEGDDEASIKQLFKLAPQQRLAILGVLGGNGGLPAGYKRVVYLECTGTQYIDTGFTPKIGDELNLDFFINEKFDFKNPLFSAGDGANQLVVVVTEAFNNRPYFYCRYFTYASRYTEIKELQKINCNINKTGSVFINGTFIFSVTPVGEVNTSLLLFKRVSSSDICQCRIYSFSISRDGVLQLDFQPCLDNTGAPCMYDMVSKKAYYNAGTGDFLYPTASTTYGLRRVLPDWGKMTEHGLRRLYHAPANYKGELYDYAIENGYKPIVEPEMPETGYWAPHWTETEDEIVLEWVETEPPENEFGLPDEDLTNN